MKQINTLKDLSFSRIFWCVFFLVCSSTGAAQEMANRSTTTVQALEDSTYRVPSHCDHSACYDRYYYQPDSNQLNLDKVNLLQPTVSYSVYCQLYNITEDKIRCSKLDCMYVIPLSDRSDRVFNKNGKEIAKHCMIIEMNPPKALLEDDPLPLISAKYFKVGGKLYKDGDRTAEDFSENTGFCSTIKDRIITRLDRKNATEKEIEKKIKEDPEPCIIREEVTDEERKRSRFSYYWRYQNNNRSGSANTY